MSSTELTSTQPATGLDITPEQTKFTPEQRAVLAHMGVENAPAADLDVFLHVCQRTGLDPFARQIHMIGRKSKNHTTDQWEVKYTIQTGIDGYRVIGHRAADRARVRVSLSAPQWAHEDGSWRSVWSRVWGNPVAARVTITRDGDPYTAVALFDEYRQTKSNGAATAMWTQRPAGQLAKCAEALAWRMALPHDLAGIYVDEEMQQADNRQIEEAPPAPAVRFISATAPPVVDPAPLVVGEVVSEGTTPPVETGEAISAAQRNAMFAAFARAGFASDARSETGRKARLGYIGQVVGREVESTNDLTVAEASRVVDALNTDAAERNTEGPSA